MSRGAKVDAIVPGWRPEDEDNDGNGVLIRYDLNEFELLRAPIVSWRPKSATGRTARAQLQGVSSEVTAQVAGRWDVSSLLAQVEALVRKVGATVDVDVDTPLMEAGLDSYLLPQVADELGTLAGVT